MYWWLEISVLVFSVIFLLVAVLRALNIRRRLRHHLYQLKLDLAGVYSAGEVGQSAESHEGERQQLQAELDNLDELMFNTCKSMIIWAFLAFVTFGLLSLHCY